MLPDRWFGFSIRLILAAMILFSEIFSGLVAAEVQDIGSRSESKGTLQYWNSESGQYRLSYKSKVEPIVINRIHNWVLYLETIDGQTVSGADITFSGGMPEHDHGLPTRPRITEFFNDGGYLVEGIRFHMRGHWELEISISVGTTLDVVLIPLDL